MALSFNHTLNPCTTFTLTHRAVRLGHHTSKQGPLQALSQAGTSQLSKTGMNCSALPGLSCRLSFSFFPPEAIHKHKHLNVSSSSLQQKWPTPTSKFWPLPRTNRSHPCFELHTELIIFVDLKKFWSFRSSTVVLNFILELILRKQTSTSSSSSLLWLYSFIPHSFTSLHRCSNSEVPSR